MAIYLCQNLSFGKSLAMRLGFDAKFIMYLKLFILFCAISSMIIGITAVYALVTDDHTYASLTVHQYVDNYT